MLTDYADRVQASLAELRQRIEDEHAGLIPMTIDRVLGSLTRDCDRYRSAVDRLAEEVGKLEPVQVQATTSSEAKLEDDYLEQISEDGKEIDRLYQKISALQAKLLEARGLPPTSDNLAEVDDEVNLF